METATFGAGCFWGVEEAFRQIDGVSKTRVGYLGGTLENPTYEDVCRGDTSHAEVVQIRFDPSRVSYGSLLTIFFSIHDPTQKNRQGPDVGDQYRSVVFFHTPEQEAAARSSLEALASSARLDRPIATEITAASTFYPAEEYHQRYLAKRGQTSCAIPRPD